MTVILEDDFESYADPSNTPSAALKADWQVNAEVGAAIIGGELIGDYDILSSNSNMALATATLKDGGSGFFIQMQISIEGSVSLARDPWHIGFRRTANTATLKAGADFHYELQSTTTVDLEKRTTSGVGQLVSNVNFGITHGSSKLLRIEVTHEDADVRIKAFVDGDEKINVLDDGTVAGTPIQTEGFVTCIFGGIGAAGNSVAIDDFEMGNFLTAGGGAGLTAGFSYRRGRRR